MPGTFGAGAGDGVDHRALAPLHFADDTDFAAESGLGISLDEVLEESANDAMSASDLDGDDIVDSINVDPGAM